MSYYASPYYSSYLDSRYGSPYSRYPYHDRYYDSPYYSPYSSSYYSRYGRYYDSPYYSPYSARYLDPVVTSTVDYVGPYATPVKRSVILDSPVRTIAPLADPLYDSAYYRSRYLDYSSYSPYYRSPYYYSRYSAYSPYRYGYYW
jgi:hypothetical protein